MNSFGFVAGLLGAAAAAFLMLPQWQAVHRGGALSVPLLVLPVIVLLAAAAIYPSVSTWREDPIHSTLTASLRNNQSALTASDSMAVQSGAEIRVQVDLGPGINAQDFGPDAALFLFARSGLAGPPVAVLRLDAITLPGNLVLTDDHAMLPGSSLADFAELKIVARVSMAGVAAAQSGDLFGEALSRRGNNAVVPVVIDQVVE